jgi:long-chain fatty acid transport protein
MGVDLQQAFMSVAFAKKVAPNLSVGVAPVLARQQIKLYGLEMFKGMSSKPESVTNNGIDESWGYGVRGGIEYALTPAIRIGIAGNTRILMQDFDKYDGMFAEHGGFDIPASVQAGIAIDIRPDLTLMADYKYINYSGIKSIANPSANIFSCPAMGGSDSTYCLGGVNGPGFGWHDINVFKVGLEWRASPTATWRVGYSYNENPIKSQDATFNIIAPGVVQHHFTAGGEFRLSDKWSLELAGAYVPESSVKGKDMMAMDAAGHPIDSDIEISMHQYEVTAGLKYRFDAGPEPLK